MKLSIMLDDGKNRNDKTAREKLAILEGMVRDGNNVVAICRE
ncbi:MAG: hypothetical protein R2744_08405 [Bacteroidales bacterium]